MPSSTKLVINNIPLARSNVAAADGLDIAAHEIITPQHSNVTTRVKYMIILFAS